MARVFITGSADGLGQIAAKRMVDEGQGVVLLRATSLVQIATPTGLSVATFASLSVRSTSNPATTP